jgi:hypothetical protein
VAVGVGVGVAGGTTFVGTLVGIGIALGSVCARGGVASAFGGGGGGVTDGGTTIPSARGPGGAATMLTRYIGGIVLGGDGRTKSSAATTARWPIVEKVSGSASDRRSARATLTV